MICNITPNRKSQREIQREREGERKRERESLRSRERQRGDLERERWVFC